MHTVQDRPLPEGARVTVTSLRSRLSATVKITPTALSSGRSTFTLSPLSQFDELLGLQDYECCTSPRVCRRLGGGGFHIALSELHLLPPPKQRLFAAPHRICCLHSGATGHSMEGAPARKDNSHFPFHSTVGGIGPRNGNTSSFGLVSLQSRKSYAKFSTSYAPSVLFYGLILFYGLTKGELAGRRPIAKFLLFKLIVTFTFYQSCRLWEIPGTRAGRTR
ncbi:hypothetical protein H4582DRAFT_537999 [Lactarius indigo]|nr:hypothetical protein H4582DRAFT_537999 [Lactarius indigo]